MGLDMCLEMCLELKIEMCLDLKIEMRLDLLPHGWDRPDISPGTATDGHCVQQNLCV